MWENIVQPGRPHMKTLRMRIACWIPKATNTHSEYVLLIPFLLQQWLHERASMLRYTYTARLVQYLVQGHRPALRYVEQGSVGCLNVRVWHTEDTPRSTVSHRVLATN